jgi:hypothetical protein
MPLPVNFSFTQTRVFQFILAVSKGIYHGVVAYKKDLAGLIIVVLARMNKPELDWKWPVMVKIFDRTDGSNLHKVGSRPSY